MSAIRHFQRFAGVDYWRGRFSLRISGPSGYGFNLDIGHENWRFLISDWTVSFGHAILFVCVCGIFVTETACPPGRSSCSKKLRGPFSLKLRHLPGTPLLNGLKRPSWEAKTTCFQAESMNPRTWVQGSTRAYWIPGLWKSGWIQQPMALTPCVVPKRH